MHRVRQIRLAVAATVPIERAQLIGGENVARHENRDTPTPSTAVRDCIRYKNALKLFIYLRINSKSVIARCAKWHKKIEIRSKTLLFPQTVHTRTEHGDTPKAQTVECVLCFDHLRPTHTCATLGRTITGCVQS